MFIDRYFLPKALEGVAQTTQIKTKPQGWHRAPRQLELVVATRRCGDGRPGTAQSVGRSSSASPDCADQYIPLRELKSPRRSSVSAGLKSDLIEAIEAGGCCGQAIRSDGVELAKMA